MTESQDATSDLGPPTDVSLEPDEAEDDRPDGDETPTSSASRYEEGDAAGGTGGLDAGGAG